MNQLQLRSLVESMQERVTLAVAPVATVEDKEKLTRAWDALVQHLALGPAPEMRACPSCARQIMRAATVCGYCWRKLAAAP